MTEHAPFKWLTDGSGDWDFAGGSELHQPLQSLQTITGGMQSQTKQLLMLKFMSRMKSHQRAEE